MPPKGSKAGTSDASSRVRQAVTKKTKVKKEEKAPRPKVLEREEKKQAKKEAKAEKKEKALEELEAGVVPKVISQRKGQKDKAKTLKKDRESKGERMRFEED